MHLEALQHMSAPKFTKAFEMETARLTGICLVLQHGTDELPVNVDAVALGPRRVGCEREHVPVAIAQRLCCRRVRRIGC